MSSLSQSDVQLHSARPEERSHLEHHHVDVPLPWAGSHYLFVLSGVVCPALLPPEGGDTFIFLSCCTNIKYRDKIRFMIHMLMFFLSLFSVFVLWVTETSLLDLCEELDVRPCKAVIGDLPGAPSVINQYKFDKMFCYLLFYCLLAKNNLYLTAQSKWCLMPFVFKFYQNYKFT